MAKQRLALLSPSHPAYSLYRRLRDYAENSVERKQEEGRRMDLEDLEDLDD